MNTFPWLLKREYWEHRGGFFLAPLWTGITLLAFTLLGLLAGEVSLNVRMSQGTVTINGSPVSIGSLFTHTTPEQIQQANHMISALLLGIDALFGMVIGFVLFFYLLGALYDDRRDRSVLFWKSMPVSDSATVLSKALTAIVMLPVLAAILSLATWLIMQILFSVVVLFHGGNPLTLIWTQSSLFTAPLLLAAVLPIVMLWMLPTAGWLLLCSAASRSTPFLWAVLIPILLGILNGWIGLLGLPHLPTDIMWSDIVKRMLLGTFGSLDVINAMQAAQRAGGGFGASLLAAYGQPTTWVAGIGGVAMTAGATILRRRSGDL